MGPLIMRARLAILLLVIVATIVVGCSDAVSEKGKDATSAKFKELNKNDKDGIATP